MHAIPRRVLLQIVRREHSPVPNREAIAGLGLFSHNHWLVEQDRWALSVEPARFAVLATTTTAAASGPVAALLALACL